MKDNSYRNLYGKGGFERRSGLSVRGSGGSMTRGRFLVAAGSLLLAGGAGGCGGGSGGDSGDDGGGSGEGGQGAIRHRYGNTEIPATAERVVTVGYTGHDAVLALGVTPVAVREWFGERPYATWAWAQDELGDAEPEVLSSEELNFEWIAALEPDLILGVTSGMTRDEYDTLSEIAPTVGQSGEYVDYGVPWQEATRTTGRALGRERRAEEEVSEVESRFQETRAKHQEFENATGVVALYGENGSFSAYGPEDTRGRFMSALGFEPPDEISELAGDQFYAEISTERLDLLDADVLVVIVPDGGREALEQDELYRQLAVVREDRAIVLETSDALAGALSFGTVLSLPYLLGEMVPRLSRSLAR